MLRTIVYASNVSAKDKPYNLELNIHDCYPLERLQTSNDVTKMIVSKHVYVWLI